MESRIINGTLAKVGDFPWHASFVIKYKGESTTAEPTFCSGAILNEKWLLATADCIANAASIRVDVGSVEINNPLVTVYPDGFILHSQFNKDKYKNNIALLRLPENSKLNFSTESGRAKYSPIRLPKRRQISESFDQYEGLMSGFGFSSPGMNTQKFWAKTSSNI